MKSREVRTVVFVFCDVLRIVAYVCSDDHCPVILFSSLSHHEDRTNDFRRRRNAATSSSLFFVP